MLRERIEVVDGDAEEFTAQIQRFDARIVDLAVGEDKRRFALQQFVERRLRVDQAVADRDMRGSDGVFLAYVATPDIMVPLIKDLDETGVKRFIAMSVPDVYQEVAGPFQAWYREHTGLVWKTNYVDTVNAIENSDLDYVILRTTWLYDNPAKTDVDVTRKGEPFKDAQITREAVAKFAAELLTGKQDYHRESLGIGEPGTAWTKPSFY